MRLMRIYIYIYFSERFLFPSLEFRTSRYQLPFAISYYLFILCVSVIRERFLIFNRVLRVLRVLYNIGTFY